MERQVTIVAGEQVARDDARDELERLRARLNARLATVPDAKDVSACPDRFALGVTGVMGHPGVAETIARGSACLLVGTRLPLTSRSGLDAALNAVPTLSIGSAPPFVPSTHVHAQDLRTALEQLIAALPDSEAPNPAHRRPVRQELMAPPHAGPGVRYRDAMAVIDDALPAAPMWSWTQATRERRRYISFLCDHGQICHRARDGRHGLRVRRRYRQPRSPGRGGPS